jgi:hypothetical protein
MDMNQMETAGQPFEGVSGFQGLAPVAPEGAKETKETMEHLDKGMEAAATAPLITFPVKMPGLTGADIVREMYAASAEVDWPRPVTREEFDALKARVATLAAHHLQTYGKAI